jgi:hypothetical protein
MKLYLYGDAESEFGRTTEKVKAKVVEEFASEEILDYEVLAAWSSEPDYEMSCWFLLRKDGKLYEVEGSHCSCMGYEDQWEPKESTIAHLKRMKAQGCTAPFSQLGELLADLEGN